MKSLFATLNFIWSAPLNRGHRMAALGRWLSWQLRSRLSSGEVVVAFGPKTRLAATSGMAGATGNIYAGLHEFEDMAFLLHFLRPEDFFVDVGANVGSYAILAAGEAGCRVAAFEPVPATFESLGRNVRLNRLEGRVDARRVCVGARAGVVAVSAGLDCMNHVAPPGGEPDALEAPADRLDALVECAGTTLIKIDVEGYETAVVAGAEQTLRRAETVAVIMELNGSGRRYGFDERALHERMLSFGFRPYSYEPFSRTLTALDGPNAKAGNTLYLKVDERLRRRLAEAPPRTINGTTF